MGIGDCVGLDDIEYAKRMKLCSIGELRIREKKKIRETFTSVFSVVGSCVAAVHTAGCCLIVGLICCRRASIAQQKLEVIQTELATRGQAKYEPQVEDCCIPFGIYTCGLGIGSEVHTLVAEHVISAAVPPSAIPAMLEHPFESAVGVTHAFQNQGAELIHAAALHSTSATQSYPQLPASVPSSTGGEAGYYTAMHLAPSVDSAGADFLSSQIADFAVNKVEKQKYAYPNLRPRR